MSSNNTVPSGAGGSGDEKQQPRGFTRRKQHEFERRPNTNGDATPPAAHSRELSLEADDDTTGAAPNTTNANSSETRSLTSTAGQPITLQDLSQRPRGAAGGAESRSASQLSAAAAVPLPPPIPPPPPFPPTKKGAAVTLATNETRQRSHSTETETTWLVRHRSKSHKKVKTRAKDVPLAASASGAISKSAMARADNNSSDERPTSPPPLPPATATAGDIGGDEPLPPTPGAAPERERRRKKKADPLHLDVDDAAPLKRNSSQGDLPGAHGGGGGGGGGGGTLRSRAESDNVPHAPPTAVVLEEKRQFLSNFLRSRPPASQIAALGAESGSSSPSLSSPKRKGLTRVDGGPIAPPLAHAASEASIGSPLAVSSSSSSAASSSTSAGNLPHRSPRSSPSPPPLPMHRIDRGGDPSPRSPHDLSPRSGSPAPDQHAAAAAANKAGVSITRLTGFQRNPDAVRAMLAAAGVDPESVPSSKARPSAPATPAHAPDGAHSAGVRRLRSVTYVRTTAIEAPIRKILQSGRFTIDVPRFERMMGDEVVYVVQITSRGGGDLGPPGWNWLVRHKFTAFANLHVILKGLRVVRDMPKFPRKGIALYTSQAMLEKRCQRLAEYLTALARTPIGRSSTFIDFLRPTKAAVYNPSGQIANVESSDDESPPPQAPLRSTSPALAAAAAAALGGGGSPNKLPPKPKGVAPQPGSAVKSRQKEKSSNKLALSANTPVVTSSLSSSGARVANGGAVRSDSSSASPPPVPSTPPPGSAAPPTPSTPPPAASTSDREDGSEEADNLALNESSGGDAQADLTTAVREAHALRRSAAQRPETLSLDDFEIIKLIGVGGFGKVFLCKKRSTGEILALKRLRKKLIEAKGQSAHVRTEKEVLEFTRALGNDSWLTRLFYSFETPDYLCLAMEYVPGGDLRIILDDFGVLDDDYARFYFCEMVMCVNTLHKLGYIHRDLKPANFLIDGHGHLKLGDFGLSKGADAANPRASVVVNRRLKAYSVVGTPQYMAKETLTGGGYDASVDWWALGCVARGTPVALADGTARTIEDAVALAAAGALELVSVDDADQRALVARCNAGQCSGVKACVRLALVDGRALELTPDHRVLTAARGWVEAARLTPRDRVVVPLLETPLDVVTADEADWSHGSLTMASERARRQTLAFARLAGRGGRDVEQACDRAAVVRDDVSARGAAVLSAQSAAAFVPAFVAGAPRAVKREFLAALCGTGALRIARGGVSLALPSAACARDVARLLAECGVGAKLRAHRVLLLGGDVQSFAARIGVRYSARRQRQLAAACLLARCGGGELRELAALLTAKARELPSTVALRVAEVRACGKRATFDLSVPGTNAFVAGGVAVHNCILYEMLVGEPPFSGETADEIFEQVRNFGDAFQKAIANSAGKADSPLSPGAGQVVLRLICDTSVRLGDEQVEDIKALPWFEGVDWNNLREAEPPFIPQLESAEDTTYFDGAKDRAEADPDKSIDRRPREPQPEAELDDDEPDEE